MSATVPEWPEISDRIIITIVHRCSPADLRRLTQRVAETLAAEAKGIIDPIDGASVAMQAEVHKIEAPNIVLP
jgi:hypothetical protein